MRNEAHHNLLLGLIGRLERRPDFYETQPYFAVALSGAEVVAAAVMTPPFPLVLSLCDRDEAYEPLAADVYGYLPETTGVNSPSAKGFSNAWHHLTGDEQRLTLAERCYRLEHLNPPVGVSGAARLNAEADLQLLIDWQLAYQREATPWEEGSRESVQRGVSLRLRLPPTLGGSFIWEDGGQPVCFAGFGSPTPNSMRIGPVYTPPEQRRRGYGSACTAAACRHILESGKRFVTLFADLANPTSNHIYQELGFEPVCDAELIRFSGR